MSWETKDDFWFHVTFICRRSPTQNTDVCLVGDFNGWRVSEQYRMQPCEEGFRVTVLLSEGFYHYKFLVDGEHVSDEANPHVSGAYGNSIMFVHMDPAVYCMRFPPQQQHPRRDYHSCGSAFHTICPEIPPDIAACGVLRRLIFVYIPPSYFSHPDRSYPVLYAHDGQNLFSTPEGEGLDAGGWFLDAKLDHWWAEGLLPEFILVAIPSAELACSGNRQREYSVMEFTSAQEEPFVHYITEVVKAAVDAQFRTNPGPEHTLTLGASLGGLFAFLLAVSRPDVFSGAVCLSPAFWFVDRTNQSTYSLIQSKASSPPPCRLYIDSGDGEGDNMVVVRDMATVLEECGWQEGTHYKYHLDRCKERQPLGITHSERVWRERVILGLQFMMQNR